jgi:hypothetical protein
VHRFEGILRRNPFKTLGGLAWVVFALLVAFGLPGVAH